MGRYKDYMEELATRGFGEVGDRSVCLECITDDGLRTQLADQLTEEACTFCGAVREDPDSPIAASFETLMLAVMEAIRFLYERSVDSLLWMDDVTRRYTSREVAESVCEGSVTDEVLEAICEVIGEDEWNEDPGILRHDVALRFAWDGFRRKVQHEARFVFLSIPEDSSDHPDDFTTAEILKKIIEILKQYKIVTDVPAGRIFYRGRMTDDESDIRDASSLGSPPLRIAAANRMSPAGISMFYGSDDVPTVVAEIRSHAAQSYAVVGAFETTRNLRMVNLAALPPWPSVFDLEQRRGFFELRFIHQFAADLSAPVVIDGREHIDYVPTQVVTEYLRWLPEIAIDGILFTSAQNGGTSCVIFCGPEGCADVGKETDKTILRLKSCSIQIVPVEDGRDTL